MLNFDLRETVAGQQLYEMGEYQGLAKGLEKGLEKGLAKGRQEGRQKGRQEGLLEEARLMVIEALEERFALVPVEMRDQINALTRRDLLKGLFKQALRCADIASFQEMLAKL